MKVFRNEAEYSLGPSVVALGTFDGVHIGHRVLLERAAFLAREKGVPLIPHRSVQLQKGDYADWDYILCMENRNVRDVLRITGGDPDGKVCRLTDFTDRPRDVADPWYTGDFEATYRDVLDGCRAFLRTVRK